MEEDYFNPKYVKTLTCNDFEGANLKKNELVVVFFYATYCGYCSQAKTDYENFSQMCPFLEVYALNGPENSQIKECINIEYNNLIQGWPSIIFFKDGKPIYLVEATAEARKAEKLKDVAMDIKIGNIPSK